jgi:hypothetical protein
MIESNRKNKKNSRVGTTEDNANLQRIEEICKPRTAREAEESKYQDCDDQRRLLQHGRR